MGKSKDCCYLCIGKYVLREKKSSKNNLKIASNFFLPQADHKKKLETCFLSALKPPYFPLYKTNYNNNQNIIIKLIQQMTTQQAHRLRIIQAKLRQAFIQSWLFSIFAWNFGFCFKALAVRCFSAFVLVCFFVFAFHCSLVDEQS